jgi:hypothetical protein
MDIRRSLIKIGLAELAALGVLCSLQPAFAQSALGGATAGVAAGDGSPGTLGGAVGPNPQFGIAIGSWLFYPSLFVGAIFNDNVYAASTNKVSAVGLRVRPSFEAINDSVVHKTVVYGTLDAQIYPGLQNPSGLSALTASRTTAKDVQGRAGVAHVWSPTADWTVRFLGDFTRQAGFFGTGIVGPANVFVPTAAVVSSTAQTYNQITGSVSIEKQITDRSFVRATGSVQGILYDRQNDGNSILPVVVGPTLNPGDNNLSYVGSLRGGYWVGPAIYIFAEGGADLRRYRSFLLDTNGYHAIAGVGSDRISLFRGEVYAGYQEQFSARGFGNLRSGAPAFGARLYYYPLQYLTVSISADQTLGAVATPSLNATTSDILPTFAAAVRTTQVRGQVDYAFSPYWTASGRGGYGRSDYGGSGRVEDVIVAGAGVSYTFWRNVAVTVDYQFTKTHSHQPTTPSVFFLPGFTGYTQNILSAGLTYRY